MNILQCSLCKKPFQSLGGKICNECLQKMDEEFIVVRDYIYENKHADIDKVSEDTGVKKQVIIHLLKEGRLIIEDASGGSGGLLTCEVCKKPINTGRMCKSCQDKLASKMQKNIDSGRASAPSGGSSDQASFKGSAKLKSK